MENNKLNNYFEDGGERALLSIDYSSIEDAIDDESFGLKIEDKISEMNTSDESLSFVLERRLEFDPQILFFLSVKIRIRLNVKEEYIGNVPWDDIDIIDELAEESADLISEPMSRVSLLIANITASLSSMPIVSPVGLIV